MQETKAVTCAHDYNAPIRKVKLDYRCRLCGADITIQVIMAEECILQEQYDQSRQDREQ